MPVHLLLFIFLSAVTMPSHAELTPFRIVNRASDLDPNDPGEAAILNAFNSSADAIESDINNGLLNESSRREFAGYVARASGSSTSAVVTDRVGDFSQMQLGVGGQGGFYSASGWQIAFDADNNLPTVGAGLQLSLSLGLKGAYLGFPRIFNLDPSKLTLFFNISRFSIDISPISVTIFNIGTNINYRILTGQGQAKWARWGGVVFGTGLNYSSGSISYSASLSSSSPTDVGGETATLTVDMNYRIGVQSTVFFVPLELSTSITLLNMFSIYMGASLDFNFGSSAMTGIASGPVNATYTQASPVPNLFSATATTNLDDGVTASPTLAMLRGFVGVQMNFYIFRAGLEGAFLGNDAYSAAFHVRIPF